MTKYDIAIIGAGPGGYVAALRGAKLGAKVLLIEANKVGGVCLNIGCIPTKTIAASAKALRKISKASELGLILNGSQSIDMQAIVTRKNKVVEGLVKGIEQLLKAGNIDYIQGRAKLNADRTISVGADIYNATNIIIATGSTWKSVPGVKLDGQVVISSDELLDVTEVPENLCIVGGGVVGCEFASIFSTLGSAITIIEALPQILPMEDKLTSNAVARSFKKAGIKVFTDRMVKGIEKTKAGAKVILSDDSKIEADKVLVAIGRKPNITGFGLENLNIKTENGAIVTDEKMQTNVDAIYAIGDVNGKYMLAHTASEEGIVAAHNIMGKSKKMSYRAIPRPIYTYPEVCGVGLTERELTESGQEFTAGRFSYMAASKAICEGATDGQVTIYACKQTGKVLGAQLIGESATEIAAEITLAITNGLTTEDIASTIHSHPTLSESIKEAAEDCQAQAIHKVYKR